MRIFKKVPELFLCRGAASLSKVVLHLLVRGSLGQEPPGAVVGVLAAGLHVEVIQPPVLQLLAEVLHTHLQYTPIRLYIYIISSFQLSLTY